MEKAYLGRTGIEISRLCFGTGTSGWGGRSDQSKLGIKGLSKLLRFAYECGITFWDSADQYGTHPHVAEALLGLKRESVAITTKTCARTREEAEKDIKRFLRELRTDYIDIALLPVSGTYVMTPEEAAEAAKIIKPKVAIPMHYGSIVGTKADAEKFKRLSETAGIRVQILK